MKNPGDQLVIGLRLPDQTAMMNVDATVRWGNHHTFGLEFTAVSQLAETHIRIFLPCAIDTGISPFINQVLCRPSPHEGEKEWWPSHAPKCLAGPMRLSLSIEKRRNDVLLIAWIGRGSQGCGDAGTGASGRVSREIETLWVETSLRGLA